jgi:hypothetical protein
MNKLSDVLPDLLANMNLYPEEPMPDGGGFLTTTLAGFPTATE